MRPRILLVTFAILTLAALGCNVGLFVPAPSPATSSPPFDATTISHTPNTAWYGESCADDQPTSFTVSAELIAGTALPHETTLRWAYELPDGTRTGWSEVIMYLIPGADGTLPTFEAEVVLESVEVSEALGGQDATIVYEIEAMFMAQNGSRTFDFSGEPIPLQFCGEQE